MVTVNNKNKSHIKDYTSSKIQTSKDRQQKDKFSKYSSSSKQHSNKRNDINHSQNDQYNVRSQSNQDNNVRSQNNQHNNVRSQSNQHNVRSQNNVHSQSNQYNVRSQSNQHNNLRSQSNQHNNVRSQNNESYRSSSPKTHTPNSSLINDLKNEINSLKTQIAEQQKESRNEISDLKKKIFRLHNEKSTLSRDVEINEVKEIDHKLKDVEKLKQDLLKSQHKNTVIKDILDETREDINSLKKDKEELIAIIEDFDNLGFIDAVKHKKPDSYYEFFKE
ncbi:MAG: hypothetical protein LBT66_02740 [Methanobrevibacter sp.]|nr:hypothetical protein [Candidatus Methanovirga meridionalis]